MYHGVKSVITDKGHHLIIEFDNGETGIFDLKPLLTIGRFHELTSIDEFNKVRVSFDTVEWENGLDLDPEYLYEKSEIIQSQQRD